MLGFYEKLADLAGYESRIHAVVQRNENYEVVSYPLAVENRNLSIVGYLLELIGPAVNIYFAEEIGFQQWRMGGGGLENVFIDIKNGETQEYQAPTNVHRQHFFDTQKPRRLLSPEALEDKKYNRECDPTESALHALLNKRFEKCLDAQLMDEQQ